MLKQTVLPFAAMAGVLGVAAMNAQGVAYALGHPCGQAVFLLRDLLALLLYAGLLVLVAGRRADLRGRRTRLLRMWLPLLAGVVLLFWSGALLSALWGLRTPDLLVSALLSTLWTAAGVWLLLAAAGRLLWALPFPRLSLRTVGRLCLCALVGMWPLFLLNWCSLSMVRGWGDSILGLYSVMAGAVPPRLPLLHGLSTMAAFAVAYAAALVWADGCGAAGKP